MNFPELFKSRQVIMKDGLTHVSTVMLQPIMDYDIKKITELFFYSKQMFSTVFYENAFRETPL